MSIDSTTNSMCMIVFNNYSALPNKKCAMLNDHNTYWFWYWSSTNWHKMKGIRNVEILFTCVILTSIIYVFIRHKDIQI